MAGILATLGGNPFNTPTGQKIEQATDASLSAENWALNMEICDLINETDEGPKDAVKAIRKRLQQNMGKNYNVVLFTLTVLETCVKNCGKRFHLLISQKDFVLDLVKLIGPKNDPPAAVQEKVLCLIQSWADAFQGNPDMQGAVQIYQDLKQKGIDFPMTDLDSMAPIITPQRSVPISLSPVSHVPEHLPQVLQPMEHLPAQASPPADALVGAQSSAITLNQDQLVKLRSELDVVQGNMKVFGEMLTELTPGFEHPQDIELLQDLHKTCYAMQNRIVELIDKIGVEEVTSELLRVNDELNNMFLRYDRYEKKRNTIVSPPIQKPPPVQLLAQPAENLADKLLIDFGDSGESSTNDISSQLSEMNITSSSKVKETNAAVASKPTLSTAAELADEFDMFAQSRNASYETNKAKGSTYADNMNFDHIEGGLGSYALNKGQHEMKEGEVENISRWLNDKPNTEQNPQDTATNTDFDKFLADRVAASEKLPSTATEGSSAAPLSRIPQQPLAAGISNRRQMDKDDSENALFAL